MSEPEVWAELNPSTVFFRDDLSDSDKLDTAITLGLAKAVESAARAEEFAVCRQHAQLLGAYVLARRHDVSSGRAFSKALAGHEQLA
jgi:hypothetical protein